MSKVITDEKMIEEVLERGVEQIFPDKETLRKKMMSGERLKLYCGFDPTASALHIGNAATINKLSQFQKLGHEVIFLVGDFTAMIGDPTDKLSARAKMNRQEVLENAKDYQKQASGYLKFDGENPAVLKYNSAWNDKLNFKELIEISSHFTVQQMIQRDMFQKRLEEEKPIYLHEFLYPLIQGGDSVALNVDLEIGGNDQMFNMLAGRTLQKVINNKDKFVLTLKLLADETGKKMGKSEGNAVFLNQAPRDMYGAVMSWTDGTIAIGFEMATSVSMAEVEKIKEALADEKNNPRDFKMKLAYEMVKINYGEKEADEAQKYFIHTIQKKEAPDEVVEKIVKRDEITGDYPSMAGFMFFAGLADSRGDAKRKIEQGGVEIDGKRISAGELELKKDLHNGKIIKVGKYKFARIKF